MSDFKELIINSKFRDLFPPLTDEEKTLLENSIRLEGCRDAIITWNNQIVDGHNRYEICNRHNIPFRTTEMEFSSEGKALEWMLKNQKGRRNLSDYAKTEAALLIKSVLEKEARDRQGARTDIKEIFPECSNGQTRDKIGELAGVSGKTVDKVEYIQKYAPEDIKRDLRIGIQGISINKAYELTKEEEKTVVEAESKAQFNQSNDNIEWAKWSWNPITGCKHGCAYCYAEDIANRFYKEGFEPTFRPERLSAPVNTPYPTDKVKDEIGWKNVFVCSMADLFGEWVPNEWIDAVLEKVEQNPQWNFLFLTKNPKKLLDFAFPKNAWVGTSVDTQARVKTAEEVFSQLEASVKFLSCEPLLEPITFDRMNVFDWLLIGSRSKNSRGAAFKPEWGWVESLLFQARVAGVKVYFKPNLFRHTPKEVGLPEFEKRSIPVETMRPREYPGGENNASN